MTRLLAVLALTAILGACGGKPAESPDHGRQCSGDVCSVDFDHATFDSVAP